MTWQPDIVIYHYPCDDGFGAAWAAWMCWQDACEYYPTNYGAPPPDVTGKRVLIVDFSYKRPVLTEMAATAHSIVVIDHHKTAMEDLQPFEGPYADIDAFRNHITALVVQDEHHWSEIVDDNPQCRVFAWFDMDKSGARLAWEFCHPGEPVPMLIQLIEDRDLWRFTFPQTKSFALWLKSWAPTFECWKNIAGVLNEPSVAHGMEIEAEAIQRYYDRRVADLVAEAGEDYYFGVMVPVVNCPGFLPSEVGNALLQAYPGAAFSVTYHDDKNGDRKVSLRSEAARADVSALAKMNGGGGHRNAAGYTIPRKYIPA